ncbi:DUF6059 family protein [Micromonospora sp. SL1-18]|uniref:DUF6059 family protein n=1 Tax=Micromonospora sp. SL1-18 TaxID=3399128 RepID=UPI003A4E3E08
MLHQGFSAAGDHMVVRRLVIRVLRFVWEGLIVLGESTVTIPANDPGGPPPGHPERWRPEVPLTRTERALARQLKGRSRLRTRDRERR